MKLTPRGLRFGLVFSVTLYLLTAGWLRGQAEAVGPALSHDFIVENWQASEGLARDHITSIAQDKQGYLWLATPPYGLIRFDGVEFRAFGNEHAPELVRGNIWTVLADREAGLWLATRQSKLLRWSDGHVHSYPLREEQPPVAVESMVQDRDGGVWLAMTGGKIGKWAEGKMGEVIQLAQTRPGSPRFRLLFDADGDLWFSYADTYGKIKEGKVVGQRRIPSGTLHLAPRHGGGMWLSTGNELRLLPPGQISEGALVATLPFSETNNEVKTIYADSEDALWVGTGSQGLLRLANGHLEKIAGVHHIIKTISEDREGNLWVGTQGAGLFKVRPRLFKLTGVVDAAAKVNVLSVGAEWVVPDVGQARKLLDEGSLGDYLELPAQPKCSVADLLGGTWFGIPGGRLFYLPKGGESGEGLNVRLKTRGDPRVLHCDRAGNLWVGTFPYGLTLVAAENPQQNQRILDPQRFETQTVTTIAENQAGEVWVGTDAGEVHRWDGHGFVSYGIKQGLDGLPIGSLLFTSDGTLWVGTLGGGLGCLREGRFKFASIGQGLPDNSVAQLIEDKLGSLWVGSSRGIFRLSRAELTDYMSGVSNSVTAVQFGATDGLQNINCTRGFQPAVWKTPAGVLRFATNSGVVSIDPAKLPSPLSAPPIVLEPPLVDGVEVKDRANLQLSANYKRIQFNYAALNLSSPDKVIYRTQLYGFDEDWNEADSKRSVSYTRLPPGRYQFRVSARTSDGPWSESPAVLAFTVQAAFWETGWFMFGSILVFIGLGVSVVRYVDHARMRRKIQRMEQVHALERERVRIARDLHDSLGARLTQMAFASDIAAADHGGASGATEQFRDISKQARLAARALDETVWMVDPRKDSVAHFVDYCGQYANDFFRRTPVGCRQLIGASPLEYPLAGEVRHQVFSAFKEVLNNVLKHAEATEVWMRINLRGNELYIFIRDNGRGFSPAEADASRHGLENMRSRMEAVGGSCVMRSQPGRGTRVLLRVKMVPAG